MSIAATAFLALAAQCAPNVDPDTLARIVKTESGFNPYAIAVVEPPDSIQAKSLDEALAVIADLQKRGLNYSIGLGQINKSNFGNLTAKEVLDPCQNLKLAERVLLDCYNRAMEETTDQQTALLRSFSCYYSNNFIRGFMPEKYDGKSYVQRIVAAKVPRLDHSITDSEFIQDAKGDGNTQPTTPVEAKPKRRVTYESWDVLKQFPVNQDDDNNQTALN
ncbi:lytic transglycosylase domain-containing protein [Escherichia coli]|uniref:lytic transglycosylase domain-containing protein n=1 Tax=Escherichia coli TaxID=562 RepID=UPI0006A5E5E2|nr:lytic transglycosylase domain-containing protein [Escherichia coli]EBR3449795.1 lytic transglycosylase domain-containing protein [Salmonella enterica]EBX4916017.1 lytic transglycosylase [Salmonella enterica subsp. enterica serovar Typhimurium]EEF4590851.1 lytic transglycosylase domain-containing protein [Salmonella enterica]EGC4914847.1 lytic transglycosylase domain-containing protein [Salmonella enterica]EHZ0788464.1 lytic transglycosylase domain-containing protein [Escherichia coli]